jgi:hypothetical protein
MPDELDPPRKYFQLKPREFETVNNPPRVPGQTNAQEEAEAAAGRISVQDLIKQAKMPGAALSGPPAQPRNEVHAILQDNLTHANAAGLNQLSPKPKRRSRRKRDYWLLLLGLDGFFAFMAFGPYANPMTFIYGIAGIIMFTLGLTWVMWFIMEDY